MDLIPVRPNRRPSCVRRLLKLEGTLASVVPVEGYRDAVAAVSRSGWRTDAGPASPVTSKSVGCLNWWHIDGSLRPMGSVPRVAPGPWSTRDITSCAETVEGAFHGENQRAGGKESGGSVGRTIQNVSVREKGLAGILCQATVEMSGGRPQ